MAVPPPFEPIEESPTKAGAAVGLALIGAMSICFGSYIGGTIPGDGQTGMVVYPCYGLGAWLGIMALVMANARAGRRARPVVWALAAIAAGSIVWMFVASEQWSQRMMALSGALEGRWKSADGKEYFELKPDRTGHSAVRSGSDTAELKFHWYPTEKQLH